MRRLLKSKLSSPLIATAGGRLLKTPLIVLLYHDLGEADDPANWLRIPVARFEEHLRLFKRHFNVVAADDILNPGALSDSCINVVLTFDDGYINSLRLAYPLLQQYGIPAVFFISTDHMISGKPFWFDEVVTSIQVNRLHEVNMSDAGLGKFTLATNPPEKRWEDIGKVLIEIKAIAHTDLSAAEKLIRIFDRNSNDRVAFFMNRYRPMDAAEVQQICTSSYVRIGSHSHKHHDLTAQEPEKVIAELRQSRGILSEIVGSGCDHIAYPYGGITPSVADAADKAGYKIGFTTRIDLATNEYSLLGLPRLHVGAFDSPQKLLTNINMLLLRGGLQRYIRQVGPPGS